MGKHCADSPAQEGPGEHPERQRALVDLGDPDSDRDRPPEITQPNPAGPGNRRAESADKTAGTGRFPRTQSITRAKTQVRAPAPAHCSPMRTRLRYSATAVAPTIPTQDPTQSNPDHTGPDAGGILPSCSKIATSTPAPPNDCLPALAGVRTSRAVRLGNKAGALTVRPIS